MDAARVDPENSWRTLLGLAVAPFLVSRLILFAVVISIDTIGVPWERSTFVTGPLLGGLTGHDAVYYLGIAAEGYHLEPVSGIYTDWVFFPAFPLVARLLSFVTLGDVAVAGVLASNLALLAGMLVVARLMAECGDRAAMRPAMWLLVLAPGAVAFGMAYSDSLLVATSAGAILAARHRRPWTTALLFGVATLTRPPGILMGLPLAVAILAADGRRPTWRLLALGAGPLALAAFAAYQASVLGDPLAFVHGQAAWDIPRLTEAPMGSGAAVDGSWYLIPIGGLLLATLLTYTAMLPGMMRSKIPKSAVLVGIVAFVSVFVSGRLQSDARYLAAGWSFAWFLSTRRRGIVRTALSMSLAGYAVLAVLNITQLLAP